MASAVAVPSGPSEECQTGTGIPAAVSGIVRHQATPSSPDRGSGIVDIKRPRAPQIGGQRMVNIKRPRAHQLGGRFTEALGRGLVGRSP